MQTKNFGVLILTHGRPNKVYTIDAIKKHGYTGNYYLVLDDEDNTYDEYCRIYGKDKVYTFSKDDIEKRFDPMDLSDDRRTIFYARNAAFDIAEQIGLDYFVEFDDDYTCFRSRVRDGNKLRTIYIYDLDSIFDVMIEWLNVANIDSVAFAQTGDFIGGITSHLWSKVVGRKAMNSFFCKTSNRFPFLGRVNEDVNTYVNLGSKGHLFFTITNVSLDQCATQSNSGGMTEQYLDAGTYVKSFYTVMCNPSSVQIYEVGYRSKRLHHRIDWEKSVPKIISSDFKIKTKQEDKQNETNNQHRQITGDVIKSN